MSQGRLVVSAILGVCMTQQEFETILADVSKRISTRAVWHDVDDSPHAKEFRATVDSDAGYPIFVNGWFNPFSGKLSYSIIHREVGRIYGLDLGAEHRNPGGELVGETHKHRWRDGYRADWAYVPEDITESRNNPIGVWEQFCVEANLGHSGIMQPPPTESELLP